MTTLTTVQRLKMWYDFSTFVIAASEADATTVLLESLGEKPEDYPDKNSEWVPIEDKQIVTVVDEDENRVRKTAEQWISEKGRGGLASEDY